MAQDQLVLLSRSQQPLYAKNPLFQPEPADARATVAGVGGYGNDVGGDGVGWGRRHEEVLAPFLDSLRSTSTDPMYSAFSAQMNNLYQVFKDLYDQDQGEIRQLLSALESQKQQLQQLAAENNGVRQQLAREREQAAAVVASAGAAAAAAQAQAQAQGRAAAKARTPQAEAGTQTEAAAGDGARLEAPGAASMARSRTRQRVGQSGPAGGDSPARAPSPVRSPGSPQGWSPTSRGGYGRYGSTGSLSPDGKARPAYVLFLPYMLHPAHHCWRFYAAWMYSWTTRRTLWLAVAWVFVFLLAVGLLVGLLVPWGELSSTEFSTPPAVANVSSTELSVTLQLNRNAMVYYAVVPEEATTHAAPPA